MRALVCVLVLGSLIGCRASRWRKANQPEQAGESGAVSMPKRTGDADATASGPTAAFDVEEKTGRLKSTLVLRLDYFPEPKPNVTNLPACFEPLPADFEIGVVTCAERPGDKRPVAVKNLDQDCYTNPKQVRIPAAQPLSLPGCKKAQVMVHAFAPSVRVDVEVKDTIN